MIESFHVPTDKEWLTWNLRDSCPVWTAWVPFLSFSEPVPHMSQAQKVPAIKPHNSCFGQPQISNGIVTDPSA